MKGYKGFEIRNGNLFCIDMQYEIGKTYKHTDDVIICKSGYHFCERLVDVNDYYGLLNENHVFAEIEANGEIIKDVNKLVCSEITVTKLLSKSEMLSLANIGDDNTGIRNSGDWNSGYYNTGNRNSGDRNSGNWNSGDWNSGYYNTGNRNSGNWNSGDRNSGNRNSGNWNSGDRNSGYYNTGDRNSGNRNSGNWNSGDRNSGNRNSGNWNSGDRNSGNWNSGDRNSGNRNSGSFNSTNRSTGFFNTTPDNVRIFNIQTNMTHVDFLNSIYWSALNSVDFPLTEWIDYTDEEKEKDETKALIGGYLKTHTYKEACAIWWKNMPKENKEIILSIPNFDAKIFEEITGIKVEADK